MRKSISFVLVLAMMLSSFILAVPASAETISAGVSGDVEGVQAPYFDEEAGAVPTIDGIVTEAEWGEASVHVDTWSVLTIGDVGKGKAPFSRFLYWRTGQVTDYEDWEYDLWIRWGLKNIYIAVKVTDPDKHSLKNGAGWTWNGDAVQTRIDWAGARPANGGAKPWSNDQVPDFIFGYTQIAGGFTEAWENTSNKGMTAFSKNELGVTNAVVAPAGSDYSSDTRAGITTYEVAIPWTYIIPANERNNYQELTYTKWSNSIRKPNLNGGIGMNIGMSLVVLDDGQTNAAGYDAFLAWGSGICGAHQTEAGELTTGSNAVMLSETKVTPQAGYPTQDPSSLINAKFSGKTDDPNVFYDYLAGDTYKETKVAYDKLTTLKYDDPADLATWGSAKLYNGTITNIGGEHGNVLDYSNPALNNNYLSTEDGVDINFKVPTSYTFEFEIRYTGTEMGADDKYASALYNWFGGADIHSFRCGYFFNDKQFQIVNDIGADGDNPDVLARHTYDLKKDNWYRWRFQFDNETCNARFWIDDLSTDADNADPWGEMIFNIKNRYFYYSSNDVTENGTLLIFRQMNVQAQYDNVKVYNFASTKLIDIPSENTGSQGSYVPPKVEQSEGTIDLDKIVTTVKDGNMYVPVSLVNEKDKQLWKNVSQFKLEFAIDTTKAEFVNLDGIDESAYQVEKSEDGTVVITFKDMAALKKIDPNAVLYNIVLKLLDENATVKQIFTKAPTYKLTATIPQEGDATVFIVIAAVVAMLGCTAVVVVRKRKVEEE